MRFLKYHLFTKSLFHAKLENGLNLLIIANFVKYLEKSNNNNVLSFQCFSRLLCPVFLNYNLFPVFLLDFDLFPVFFLKSHLLAMQWVVANARQALIFKSGCWSPQECNYFYTKATIATISLDI